MPELNPKFKLGTEVALKEHPGRTGIVLLWDPYRGVTGSYYVEVYPGAICFSQTLLLTGPDGEIRWCNGNWLGTPELEALPTQPDERNISVAQSAAQPLVPASVLVRKASNGFVIESNGRTYIAADVKALHVIFHLLFPVQEEEDKFTFGPRLDPIVRDK